MQLLFVVLSIKIRLSEIGKTKDTQHDSYFLNIIFLFAQDIEKHFVLYNPGVLHFLFQISNIIFKLKTLNYRFEPNEL